MNLKLLEIVKELSRADGKTLSQKALKTSEEVGELAKAVLPFDNAVATRHRFSKKEDVIEEAVDTILCALSVIYEVGGDEEDFYSMAKLKTEKWAWLLKNEERLTDKTPFEIHVTVRSDNLDDFRSLCKLTEVKPVIIDLQDKEGRSVMQDVMTSSVHLGTNKSAYDESMRIKDSFSSHGFEVVRTKIETVPWHPASPKKSGDKMPDNCYFESHLAVICNDGDLDELKRLASDLGVHMSRNIFKKLSDTEFVVMLTDRSYDMTQDDFDNHSSLVRETLIKSGFEVEKKIVEFSIYDTKVSHDSAWINK